MEAVRRRLPSTARSGILSELPQSTLLVLGLLGASVVVLGVQSSLFAATDDVWGALQEDHGWDREAVDAAKAASFAMSCTALMNAHAGSPPYNGEASEVYRDIQDTWRNGPTTPLIDTPCREAAPLTGAGVDFGDVNVKCEEFHKGGICEIFRFHLPNEKIRDKWWPWIRGGGHPKYLLYYQSLPEYVAKSWRYKGFGIDSNDWQTTALMIGAAGWLLGPIGGAVSTPIAAGYAILNVMNVRGQLGVPGAFAELPAAKQKAAVADLSQRLSSYGVDEMTPVRQAIARDAASAAYAHIPGNDSAEQAVDGIVESVMDLQRESRADPITVEAEISGSAPALDPSVTGPLASRIAARSSAAAAFAEEESETLTNYPQDGATDAFYRNFFRNYLAADDLANMVEETDPEEHRIFRRIYGQAHATLRNLPIETRRKTVTNARRAACASNAIRPGTLSDLVTVIEVSDPDQYGEHLPKRLKGSLLRGPTRSLGGTAICRDVAERPDQAIQQMCTEAGANPGAWIDSHRAQYRDTGVDGKTACAALTALGTAAIKQTGVHAPHYPGGNNALYLYSPIKGEMQFPLNNYTNFYFVGLDKQNPGFVEARYHPFHLVSPMNFGDFKGVTNAHLTVAPTYLPNVFQGPSVAEKEGFSTCDEFRNFQRHVEGAVADGVDFVTGSAPDPPPYFVNRTEAERRFHGSAYAPSGMWALVGCTANIIYTPHPIVGRKVMHSGDNVTAPPGYAAVKPYAAPPGEGEMATSDRGYAVSVPGDEEDVDRLAWSHFMPMKQPRDHGRGTSAFKQIGAWDRPTTVTERDVEAEELQDVVIVLQWPNEIPVPDLQVTLPEICFTGGNYERHKDEGNESSEEFNVTATGEETCVGLSSVGLSNTVTIPTPDIPFIGSADDDEPGLLPDPPQVSVAELSDIETGPNGQVTDIDLETIEFAPTDSETMEMDAADHGTLCVFEDLSNIIGWIPSPPDWVPDACFGLSLPFMDASVALENNLVLDTQDPQNIEDGEFDGRVQFEIADIGVDIGAAIINTDIPGPVSSIRVGPVGTAMDIQSHVHFNLYGANVPQRYVGPRGQGVSQYTYPTIPDRLKDIIDSNQDITYHVNSLAVRVNMTGAGGGPHEEIRPNEWRTSSGKPIYGHGGSHGQGWSAYGEFIYWTGLQLGTAWWAVPLKWVTGFAPLVPEIDVIGMLEEKKPRIRTFYLEGCDWPHHGCSENAIPFL